MLEKPRLPDEKIAACLRGSYGVPVAGIEFLPIGNDSSAWAYKVSADDGRTYFLKVKQGTAYEPGVMVPRYLKDRGIAQVVAPLSTTARTLWAGVDGFTLILYPFVEGRTGMDIGLSDGQWVEFGAVLKQIHSDRLPPELWACVEKETFSPKWSRLVRVLQARIEANECDGVFERELASFWRGRRGEIKRIVDRTEELGRMLRDRSSAFVLCHCDIHTANILLDREDRMFIVDWDNPLLAPKERDLMFVVGGAGEGAEVRSKEEALFFRGYGRTDIDPLALAYYRYEWVVQEIGDYGKRVFLMDDIGEETRQDAVRGFLALFQPGDVVESAYESEREEFAAPIH